MIQERLELTVKALIIGIILNIIFIGTNIYLGLKIGITVSASIPAAVLAMGFLRFFKQYSNLENSISQTTASVGEATAASIIFVFPALLILNVWNDFHYVSMLWVMLPGTIIGVIYSIILRKVLLNDKQLGFPEGQAIGRVLQTTESAKENSSSFPLILGMLVSGIISFCQNGLQVLSASINKAFLLGNKLVGGGISFSVAVMGAGYLVGFAQMFVSFVALIFAWCVLLPIFTSCHGINDPHDMLASAFFTWKNYVRPVGIGVFIFAGFATILTLIRPIISGLKESVIALINLSKIDEKEKDINIIKLFVLLILVSIPIGIMVFNQLNNFNVLVGVILSILIVFFMLIVGFIIASISGYFAGLAGSSISPVSGLLFIAVIIITLTLKIVNNHSEPHKMLETIILFVGFIAGASAITNGSIQDFKSGQIVGSAPYKQQIALFLGSIVAVIFAPLLISLIFNAYGIAGVVPHAGMDPTQTLSAPQASAVATLTKNILVGLQNWNLIFYGILIGIVALITDLIGCKSGKFRCSIVSIGMGIYLPPDVVTILFIGGCLRLIVNRRQDKISQQYGKEVLENSRNRVNLLVCGLIAGESLVGLVLAIPFVLYKSSDALKIVGKNFANTSVILSIITITTVIYYVYKTGTKVDTSNKSKS